MAALIENIFCAGGARFAQLFMLLFSGYHLEEKRLETLAHHDLGVSLVVLLWPWVLCSCCAIYDVGCKQCRTKLGVTLQNQMYSERRKDIWRDLDIGGKWVTGLLREFGTDRCELMCVGEKSIHCS